MAVPFVSAGPNSNQFLAAKLSLHSGRSVLCVTISTGTILQYIELEPAKWLQKVGSAACNVVEPVPRSKSEGMQGFDQSLPVS